MAYADKVTAAGAFTAAADAVTAAADAVTAAAEVVIQNGHSTLDPVQMNVRPIAAGIEAADDLTCIRFELTAIRRLLEKLLANSAGQTPKTPSDLSIVPAAFRNPPQLGETAVDLSIVPAVQPSSHSQRSRV